MTTSKRICKNGSITLPKQIRAEAGMFPGNAVICRKCAEKLLAKVDVTND